MPRDDTLFVPAGQMSALAEQLRRACLGRFDWAANAFQEAATAIRDQDSRPRGLHTQPCFPPEIERPDFADQLAALSAHRDAMAAAIQDLLRGAETSTQSADTLIGIESDTAEQLRRWLPLERTPVLARDLEKAWTMWIAGTETLHWGTIAALDPRHGEAAMTGICRKTRSGYQTLPGMMIVTASDLTAVPPQVR